MQDERPYHAGGRLGQPSDVVALRRALVAAGFTPLPLFGKAPPSYGKNGAKKGLGGWQHLEDVSAEQIDDWSRTSQSEVNPLFLLSSRHRRLHLLADDQTEIESSPVPSSQIPV